MLAPMHGYLRSFALTASLLVLAACASTQRTVVVEPPPGSAGAHTITPEQRPAPGGTYKVGKGDTLYSIAFRNKVDFRDLASWNNIAAPYTIWPGQELKLAPPNGKAPASTAAHAPPVVVAASAKPVAAHPATAPAGGQAQQPGFAPVTEAAVVANTASSTATLPPAAVTTTVVPVAGAPAQAANTTPPPAPVAPAPAGATRNNGGVSWRWPADGSLIKRFQSGDAIPGIEIAGKTGDPVRAAADGVVVYSGNGLVGYGELVIVKHNDSFLSAYGHNSKRLVKEGQRVSAGQQIAEMGATGASRDELQFQIRKDGNPVDPMGYLPSR